MIEPMISPAEQGVAKHLCLVIGTLVVGGYLVVLVMAMISSLRGE